jgi:hypothetical protein
MSEALRDSLGHWADDHYEPCTDNWADQTRNDQDIWDLVGTDPGLHMLMQTYCMWDMWSRTLEETEAGNDLFRKVVIYERNTYDRFSKKYPRPSEEINKYYSNEPVLTGIS